MCQILMSTESTQKHSSERISQSLHLYLQPVINLYSRALAFSVLLLIQLCIFTLITSTETAFLHMIYELHVQYFNPITY